MRTVFSKSPSPARTTPPPSPPRQTFSESLMDEDIEQTWNESIVRFAPEDLRNYMSDLFNGSNSSGSVSSNSSHGGRSH
ncbi:hypothetical protein SLEP1_g13654 [Rubroshorea leprosula]|uniref:Uncharacterized protein n=1 Tax=Rubroshorea leprosula TaxID=152421 RepID=A0AAV5IS65_9ROSI|nr:hypothetical protein SLEP1_g13654 [Rubroshorea leprosula]